MIVEEGMIVVEAAALMVDEVDMPTEEGGEAEASPIWRFAWASCSSRSSGTTRSNKRGGSS